MERSKNGPGNEGAPVPPGSGVSQEFVQSKKQLESRSGEEVAINNVEWLWPNWIPQGKLSCLDGDPGLGKSTVLLDLAARVTTTGVMPDGSQGLTGNVAILSAEDDAEDTIKPRLLTAGADLRRILFWDGVGQEPFRLPEHLPIMRAAIMAQGIKLLIIDPLSAFLSAQLKSDAEVRIALYPLAKMASELRVAILYLRHLNKTAGTKALYRGGGSIGIIGAARAAFLIAEDPDDPQHHRVLAHMKHNLAPRQPSRRYSLLWLADYGQCKVCWSAEPSPHSADDLLKAPPTEEEKEKATEKKSCFEEARDFLTQLLGDGEPKLIMEIRAEASVNGLNWETVRWAARGFVKFVHKAKQHWWYLPQQE